MRVLQLGKYYDPYMGGIETHLSLLCGELRTQDEVEVLVCNTGRGTEHGEVKGIQVTRAGAWARAFSTEFCPGLIAEISRRTFDVLHLHAPNPMGMLAYLLARKPRNHRLVITHHSDVVRQAGLRRALHPLFAMTMNRAHCIIASSPNYLETSVELAPYRDRVRVVPYGIDPAPYQEPNHARAGQQLRARFGERVLLAAGRLIYYKGFETLLEAMTQVEGHLVLIGEGPLGSALRRKARTLGIEGRVTFAGAIHQSEMPGWYRAADAFVLPSIARSEAFGIVQLEAMAAGLPVVNTQLDSGVPFVSIDGQTGLTVAPHDPTGLARAINKLLADRELRECFGRRAKERVNQLFTKARMIDHVRAIYRGVLTSAPLSEIVTAA
jgi:rhamnosyl/mannosyltransferase